MTTQAEVFHISFTEQLDQHPLSAAWPPMDPQTFQELRQSIQDDGIQTPITVYQGQVLDGWHRYNVTQLLGIDCPATEYTSDDPAGFVIRANHLRRMIMTPRERVKAVLACRNWTTDNTGRPRRDRDTPEAERTYTNREIADESQASVRTVQREKQRQSNPPPTVTTHPPASNGTTPANPPIPANDDDPDDFPDFGNIGETASVAEQSEFPQPTRKPSPLSAQAYEAKIAELQQDVEDLKLRALFNEADPDGKQAILDNLETECRTLRAQVAEWMGKAEAAERELEYLRRQSSETGENGSSPA